MQRSFSSFLQEDFRIAIANSLREFVREEYEGVRRRRWNLPGDRHLILSRNTVMRGGELGRRTLSTNFSYTFWKHFLAIISHSSQVGELDLEKMNLVCEETVNDYVDTDIFRKANNVSYVYSSDEDSGTGTQTGTTSSAESGTGSSIASSSYSSTNLQSSSSSSQQAQTQYCAHITTKPCFANTAVVDKTFLHDRCLENLLKDEDRHKTVCSYFYTVQKDITPPMRKIVADWMMEVSLCLHFCCCVKHPTRLCGFLFWKFRGFFCLGLESQNRDYFLSQKWFHESFILKFKNILEKNFQCPF